MMIQLGMVHPASETPYERLRGDGDTKPLAECERGTVDRGKA